jgi:hypothetical protein
VRYESVSARSGDVVAVVVSGDGREAAVEGRRREATISVRPWVFRDRGVIDKVWMAWEPEGDRVSILLCQSEVGAAFETVDFGSIWGTGGRREMGGLTKAVVLASLRANFRGAPRGRGGEDEDILVGEWLCTDRSAGELERFTRDGGKRYVLP